MLSKASTRDTQDVNHLGEEKVFTAAEVATAVKLIKSGNSAGENEISHEMLKALTEEGIFWLPQVCQVSWKSEKTTRNWQTSALFFRNSRKEITSNIRTTEEYHSLVSQEKYALNVSKENA